MNITANERVLSIVKVKGPVVPAEIAKDMGMTSFLAAAVLAELVSTKLLRISSLKVGGSPVYFASGQEDKLQNYMKYLHERERQALVKLKEGKILRDNELDPVSRVALRQAKDFASPLEVRAEGSEIELYWKWYLLTNDEVEPLIKESLEKIIPQKVVESAVVSKEEIKPQQLVDEIKKVTSHIEKSAVAEKLSETSVQQQLEPREKVTKTVEKKIPFSKVTEAKVKETPIEKQSQSKDQGIIDQLAKFFKEKNIEIVTRLPGGKKSEAELIIKVPSAVGQVQYYCMVKDKSTVNEAELSLAYVQGQGKNLPVLFITTGNLSKKAIDMAATRFTSMSIIKI